MGLIKWSLILVGVAFLGYHHAIREQEKVDVWNYKVKLLTHEHPSVNMIGYSLEDDVRLGSAVRFMAFGAFTEKEIRLPVYSLRVFSAIREFCDAYAAGGDPEDDNLRPPRTWNPIRRFLDIYRPAKSPAVFVRYHRSGRASWWHPQEARDVIVHTFGIDIPMVYPDGWLEAGGRRYGPEDESELRGPYHRNDFDYPFKN